MDGWLPVVTIVLQGIVVPGVGYALRMLHDLQRQLRMLNGRLIRIEEWRVGQERRCVDTCAELRDRVQWIEHKEAEHKQAP